MTTVAIMLLGEVRHEITWLVKSKRNFKWRFYMKNILYTIIAVVIAPIACVAMVIYGLLYVLQLLFRTINLWIENGMRWIDRNITSNIR